MAPVVRAARPGDLSELTRIYNHYVRTSGATFDLEEQSLDARRAWLEPHDILNTRPVYELRASLRRHRR